MQQIFETLTGKKTGKQIMDMLMYGSYSANRCYGCTHEQLVKIGIGNEEMRKRYEAEAWAGAEQEVGHE